MISGEKIYLQGITKEDAPMIYKWVNREDLRALTGTLYPVSEFEHGTWVEKQVTGSDRKLFMICCRESDRKIGTIGLRNFDWINRNAELFISIGETEEYTSKGYGSDAVKTFVKYCFEHINLHKIYLHVFESNGRAIRCYEKAGFQREGILKEHHFSRGAYEAVLVMSILSEC